MQSHTRAQCSLSDCRQDWNKRLPFLSAGRLDMTGTFELWVEINLSFSCFCQGSDPGGHTVEHSAGSPWACPHTVERAGSPGARPCPEDILSRVNVYHN